MNVNKIIITGNLTADPELRYTPSGKAVLSASIANNEHFTDAQGQEQKVTTFVNLEVWGRPAENFGKLVKKGQELFRRWQAPHGRMERQTDQRSSYASLSLGRELAIHPI
jgi:single-strand DNA-binding protein